MTVREGTHVDDGKPENMGLEPAHTVAHWDLADTRLDDKLSADTHLEKGSHDEGRQVAGARASYMHAVGTVAGDRLDIHLRCSGIDMAGVQDKHRTGVQQRRR